MPVVNAQIVPIDWVPAVTEVTKMVTFVSSAGAKAERCSKGSLLHGTHRRKYESQGGGSQN